jgi:hypothetical protein
MTTTAFKMTVLALIGLGIGAGNVHADKAQVEAKLGQELAIKLDNVTIVEVLKQIGEKAGVKISLSPEAVWKLPEGEQTRLSVTLEGRLAESLEKMLNSFFMRYAVSSDSLTIYPRPELKRIIGRPTAAELKLLVNLYGSRMWISGIVPAQKVVSFLVGEPVAIVPVESISVMDRLIIDIAAKEHSSGRPHDANSPQNPSAKGAPVTVALLLEAVERSYQGQRAWYLVGPEFPRQVPEIRTVEKREYWQAHLDQIIDVSFIGEEGESVVRKLAAWAGLDVQISDPWTSQMLAQKITLEVQNVKLVDALDKALSSVSVRWETKDGVLRLYRATPREPVNEPPQQAAGESQTIDGYVGKISIPMDGGRYFVEFMLRESDLPEELRKLRQQVMNDVIAELSREGKIKEVLKQLSSQPAEK